MCAQNLEARFQPKCGSLLCKTKVQFPKQCYAADKNELKTKGRRAAKLQQAVDAPPSGYNTQDQITSHLPALSGTCPHPSITLPPSPSCRHCCICSARPQTQPTQKFPLAALITTPLSHLHILKESPSAPRPLSFHFANVGFQCPYY